MIRSAVWLLLWPGLALALPGDIDDDSILDPVDNCLEAFNPEVAWFADVILGSPR